MPRMVIERDQGVGQRVAVDHAPPRNAGRPGGLDVVGFEDLQHRRAHHAGDRRHDAEAEREGGQHELMQRRAERRPVAGEQAVDDVEAGDRLRRRDPGAEASQRRRRHAQQIEEDVERQQPGPEGRHGDAGHADDAAEMVDRGVAMDGRLDAERDAQHQRDQQAGQGELERCRQALPEILQHRPAGRRALAEIAVHDARDVAPVLDPGRLVEAHGLFQLLHDLGRHQRAPPSRRRDCRAAHR